LAIHYTNNRKELEKEEEALLEQIRKSRESEYLDVKILSLNLIDFVPYEKKQQMVEIYRKLLLSGGARREHIDEIVNRIPDLSQTGTFGISCIARIFNKKKFERRERGIRSSWPIISVFTWMDVIYLDLPDAFEFVEIWIKQSVDFLYSILYYCKIDKSYRSNKIKDNYVKSTDMLPVGNYEEGDSRPRRLRGPLNEPSIGLYETVIGEFLAKLNIGLFLGESYTENHFCPSIRVLSTSEINFDNIQTWLHNHLRFLHYMQIATSFNKYRNSILAYNTSRLYNEIPSGITIVYSEKHVGNNSISDIYHDVIKDSLSLTENLTEFLLPYYWSAYQYFNTIRKWRNKVDDINTKSTQFSIKYDSSEIKNEVESIMNLYRKFMTFANREKVNIRRTREHFNNFGRHAIGSADPLRLHIEFDILKDLNEGVNNRLQQEETTINEVQDQFETLLEYYRDLSNLKLSASNVDLQKQVKILAIITVIIGFVAAIPVILDSGKYFHWW
jgi:hypothetical protein